MHGQKVVIKKPETHYK